MEFETPEVKKVSGKDISYDEFLTLHSGQLKQSDVPERYWQPLFHKIKDEVFDAGQYFQLQCVQVEEEEDGEEEKDNENEEEKDAEHSWNVVVIAEDGIDAQDPKHIYLIDHAWTYRTREAKDHLLNIPGLTERMSGIMGVDVKGREEKEIIDDILREMWRHNQFYMVAGYNIGSDESMPYWYVMDEFGSRIQHSDDPSVKIAPFLYAITGVSYSIMWPVKDMEKEEDLTRDYLVGVLDSAKREAKMNLVEDTDVTHVSYQQVEPSLQFFQAHDVQEFYPEPLPSPARLSKDQPIKVFVQYVGIPYVTEPKFVITKTKEEADIWFITDRFRDYRDLSLTCPNVMINQFPNSLALISKDLLSVNCARSGFGQIDPNTLESSPDWLALTYNLQTELPKFVSYFQHREQKGLENSWIIKPWGLNRAAGISVSDNLCQILRLAETLPSVACKYVTDVVTLYRDDVSAKVKFDLRYECLLCSVKPVKLYVHQVFVARCANRAYDLQDLDDVQKHLTMLKNFEGVPVYEIPRAEFVPRFEQQYPDVMWADVEKSIFDMLLRAFEAVTEKGPPVGVGHYDNSRSLYGADVILKWTTNKTGERVIKPLLCEMNLNPNLEMFRNFYPDISNDILSTLFLDDTDGRPVTLLTGS